MVGEELRVTLDRIGAKLDQGNGDPAVQLGPLVAKKGADCRILDQCVFELITFAVGISSRVDKLSLDQVAQGRLTAAASRWLTAIRRSASNTRPKSAAT